MTTKLGRFEVRGTLGGGGTAEVYRAYDPQNKREVALKAVARYFSGEEKYRRLFEHEAQVIASLEHSAIVPLYDFGDQNDRPYLVMRLMPGGSLADYLRKSGAVSLDKAIEWLSPIAKALDFAHSKGVVHRDLKPSNILFDSEDRPCIADFGIAKLIEKTTLGMHKTGQPIGTPAYISPELARGEKKIDGRSDVYSLGVVLFELLTGRLPYESHSQVGFIHQHLNDPVPNILEINRDLPLGCQTVIERAMHKKAKKRYASAGEMVEALKAARDGRLSTSPSLVKRSLYFLAVLAVLFAVAEVVHKEYKLLAVIVVIGLLLFVWRKFFGGPVGTLKLVSSRQVVAGPWKLGGYRRHQTIRGRGLEAYGVKMIKVSKAKPPNSQVQRAIKVKAINMEGRLFMMDTLWPDKGPQAFADGAEISYE